MNRRLMIAVRILAIAAIAAGLWWFVRAMNVDALGRALRTAKLWPIVVGVGLNFGCQWGKAVAWRLMLAPRHKVPVLRLFRYSIATFAASAIAPARAGEVLRIWTLKRRDGVPAADGTAVAFAEKLLDGISMLILVAPVLFLLPGLPSWVANGIALTAVIVIASFIVLYIAVGRVDGTASRSLVRRLLAGMHVLRSPKRLFGALAVLLLVWTADLFQVMAVLYAVDLHLPIAAGMLILFTLNLTIMVPSTPAQAGALELGVLFAADLLHVSHEPALAFALLYHALQVIPLIVVGLLFELRLVLGRDDTPAATTGATTGATSDPAATAAPAPPPGEPPAASATHPPP